MLVALSSSSRCRKFLEEETYETFIQDHRKSEGRDGLGFTLDTRHSDTNFTLAVRDARVHMISNPAGDRGSVGVEIKLTTQLFLEEE